MSPAAPALALPPFYCPLDSPLHPRVAEIEREAVAWLDRTGTIGRDADRAWCIASHAAEFSARLGPHAPYELVLLFAQWNYCLFAFDDAGTGWDGLAQDLTDIAFRVARSVESPGAGMLGDSAFARAIADLASRTRQAVSPGQFQRIADGLREFLLGAAWQSRNEARGVMSSVSDYIAGRLADVGGRFDTAFIEVLSGTEIPACTLYSQEFRALADAVGFVVACDNDLVSYAKEEAARPPEASPAQNILTVLMHHEPCDLAGATTRAVELRDHAMSFFLTARDTIWSGADPETRRYLQGLGYFIAGNLHWSDNAPRYAVPRVGDELPPERASLDLTWREIPVSANTGAVSLPASIAWW